MVCGKGMLAYIGNVALFDGFVARKDTIRNNEVVFLAGA